MPAQPCRRDKEIARVTIRSSALQMISSFVQERVRIFGTAKLIVGMKWSKNGPPGNDGLFGLPLNASCSSETLKWPLFEHLRTK